MARYPLQENTRQLIAQADKYFYAGSRLPAIRLYNQALSSEPECIYALVQRGLALQGEGRVEVEKKIMISPSDWSQSTGLPSLAASACWPLKPAKSPIFYGKYYARNKGPTGGKKND